MEFLQIAFLVKLVLLTVIVSQGQELPGEYMVNPNQLHSNSLDFDGFPQVPDALPTPEGLTDPPPPYKAGMRGEMGDEEDEPHHQQQQQRYPPPPPREAPGKPRGSKGYHYQQYHQHYEHNPDEEPPIDPEDDSPPPYVLSFVYLRHLAGVEEKMYPLMTEYVNVLEKRLKIIKNYLKDYEDSSLRGTRHIENTPENPKAKVSAVAAHPLMAYRLVRRFSSELKALEREFTRGYEREFTQKLTKLEGRHKWPGVYEHEQAMAGILRVHYIYGVDIKQYSAGIIGGVDTGVGLTAKQTFHIAKFATFTNYYTLAMDWLSATSWKLRNTTNCDDCAEISANTLALAYRNNIERHNEEFERVGAGNSSNMYMYTERIESDVLPKPVRDMQLEALKQYNFSLQEVDVNAIRNYNYYGDDETPEQEEDEEGESKAVVGGRGDPADFRKVDNEESSEEEPDEEEIARVNAILELRSHFNYITLCNGESTQTEAEKAKLYCWYERRSHPYWYIRPLQMELLNPEPYLVQMYDFLPQSWIDYLIKKATPISNAPPPPTPEATPRSAAYAWLTDEDIDEIPLSLRIEHVTGLHVRGQEASTDLQIASYVSGAHVANHVDSLGEGNDPRGDRVTTFLIYLNDVEKGGYTAYPLLGTFVKPIKGSVILWYDSLKNGQIDNRMLHGACPPILGSKWIATKWTHLNVNFQTRKCDLDPFV